MRLGTILAAAGLIVLSLAESASAQKVEFSADMQVRDTGGTTQIAKLAVGNQRARLDRATSAGEINGSLVIDFDKQFLYFVIPQSKMYMKILGSEGTFYYRGAWVFRPSFPSVPCGGWITEANQRGITLRCKQGVDEVVDGRTVQKWDGETTDGAHGSIWYDPHLNFIVKMSRTSKDGTQSGYELRNVKEATQPSELFRIPSGYREFTLNKLVDLLTGVIQW